MILYTITTHGCREQLCRLGLLDGSLITTRVPDRRVTILSIQRAAAAHFGTNVDEMKSRRRERTVVRPRQIAMYLARQLTACSFPEIGRAFGNRDHTTVIHAVRTITRLRIEDGEMDVAIQRIERDLRS